MSSYQEISNLMDAQTDRKQSFIKTLMFTGVEQMKVQQISSLKSSKTWMKRKFRYCSSYHIDPKTFEKMKKEKND